MHAIIAGLGWFAGLLVMVFGIVNLLVGHILPTLVLVVLAFLLLPPTRAILHRTLGHPLPWWATTLAVVVLSVTYLVTLVWSILSAPDVFKTAEVEAAMMAIYDEKLADWPVPYETRMVETSYGQVYVIISGDAANPPMLLFHASAMSAWSWRDNIAALSQDYRTYAIDTLGEANRSVLTDTSTYPTSAEDITALYAEVADALDVERAVLVGASYGGFIATNYALHYPERTEAMALLGPMGLTPATAETAMRIMLVQCFPLPPIQQGTARWALGDDPAVLAASEEWFRYVVSGTLPRVAPPRAFTPAELEGILISRYLIRGISSVSSTPIRSTN